MLTRRRLLKSAAATGLITGASGLAAPAIAREPVIGVCLEALSDAALARMSGSGATCFGLYATAAQAEAEAHRIASAAPRWWVAAAPILAA